MATVLVLFIYLFILNVFTIVTQIVLLSLVFGVLVALGLVHNLYVLSFVYSCVSLNDCWSVVMALTFVVQVVQI